MGLCEPHHTRLQSAREADPQCVTSSLDGSTPDQAYFTRPPAWQPNRGRGSTYQGGKSVQTTATTSDRLSFLDMKFRKSTYRLITVTFDGRTLGHIASFVFGTNGHGLSIPNYWCSRVNFGRRIQNRFCMAGYADRSLPATWRHLRTSRRASRAALW